MIEDELNLLLLLLLMMKMMVILLDNNLLLLLNQYQNRQYQLMLYLMEMVVNQDKQVYEE
jgi:hypothetical protein